LGLRSAGRAGFDAFLKLIGLLFIGLGLIIMYATQTSIGQLGEEMWLFIFIGFLLICLGLFLLLARTS